MDFVIITSEKDDTIYRFADDVACFLQWKYKVFCNILYCLCCCFFYLCFYAFRVSTVFCSGESVFFRFSAHLLAAHRMSLLTFSMTLCFFRQIYNGDEGTMVTFGYFG